MSAADDVALPSWTRWSWILRTPFRRTTRAPKCHASRGSTRSAWVATHQFNPVPAATCSAKTWKDGGSHLPRILLATTLAILPSVSPAADGKTLFGTDCGLCHQRDGGGVPGSFPRLAGRFGLIAAKPEGKTYLTHVLAFGMTGMVTIDGKMIIGYMPAFGQVPPADLAAILTYVSGLGGTTPVTFTPDEIIAGRKTLMSPMAVHQERDTLAVAKIVP